MKNLLLTLILILSFQQLQSKDWQTGYFTIIDSSTFTVSIKITKKGYIQYKMENENRSQNIAKRKLSDFGYIIDGQKVSKYAEFGFSKTTLEGFYINADYDTIPFYITSFSQAKIKGFTNKRAKKILLPKYVETVGFIENGEYIIYDAFDFSEYVNDKNANFFVERLSNGKVNLYNLDHVKSSFEKLETPIVTGVLMDSGLNTDKKVYIKDWEWNRNYITRGFVDHRTTLYLIKKGNVIHLIPNNPDDDEKKINSKLKNVFGDCPMIASKIGGRGYTVEDLIYIAEEYNQYWSNLKNKER